MDKNTKQNGKTTEDGKQNEIEENQIEEPKDKKYQELEEKIYDYEEKWKRAIADYQNQEKWVREQRAEWVKSANKDLLLRILPVLDTLFLAIQHSEDKNLKVSIDQFLAVLKEEGVVKIDTLGKEFDPFQMEAISSEPGEENKVIKELRVGYMLFDKILRPAQVTVGNGNKL